MIRPKHTSTAVFSALAALPLLAALPAQADIATNTAPAAPVLGTAKPTPSVAVAPPSVTAEPSPSANMAYSAQRGIVISRPGANAARISLGARNGLRVGTRIEFLRNGLQIATGTINALNYGDAVATLSPEPAEPYVGINTDIRVLEIPAKNLGPTQEELDDKEFSRFERDIALSAIVAAGIYYGFIRD